jgi:6-phosphogluconolactonase
VVYVYPDADAMSRAAARHLAERMRAAAAAGGRCAIALSGGNTPGTTYRLLAGERVPWDQVHLFWGDERYVPATDPQSNYRMVQEALLNHIAIPEGNIHPIATTAANPDDAARAYETILREQLPGAWPRFDLVLLGLGTDGHIASLFPGSDALRVTDRCVVAVQAPVVPPRRITITLPVINAAAAIHFLVSGKDKSGAVHRARVGPSDVEMTPAAGVRSSAGAVTWWIDEAAATMLGPAVRASHPPAEHGHRSL